ncbi:oligosaccharide flippase family protein [Brachybacterium sp. Z12]|nr:oligosaccharide flippase family protein [Brachybacterium sp. Z12]
MAQLAIQMTALVVLARLLEPREYGLMAIVTVVIGIGEVFRDVGLSTAAVQAKEISPAQRSNLWWCATGIGSALAVLLLCVAPLIAGLYHQPELLLMLVAMSASFPIAGMASQLRAGFQREMRFGALALITIVTGLVALGVAILAALSGWGAWALVVQNLTGATLSLIALLLFSSWRPRRYYRPLRLREEILPFRPPPSRDPDCQLSLEQR